MADDEAKRQRLADQAAATGIADADEIGETPTSDEPEVAVGGDASEGADLRGLMVNLEDSLEQISVTLAAVRSDLHALATTVDERIAEVEDAIQRGRQGTSADAR